MSKFVPTNVPENIRNYIEIFSKKNPILGKLQREHCERKDVIPNIGPEAASLIAWIIKLTKAKSVLEFGTCIGYSAIALGEAVKSNDGKLITIERAKCHYDEAVKNIKKAKLENTIEIINDDAETAIERLDGPFDIILQDAAKNLYTKMLDKCITKIRRGGILIADDTLFKPMGIQEKFSKHMDKYNELVFSHSELESVILPIGDGLTLSYKK